MVQTILLILNMLYNSFCLLLLFRVYIDPLGDFNYKSIDFTLSGVWVICICNIAICFLQIWDTAGQERFKSLRTPFYRGSDMCLLTFALDDHKSFENLETWRKEFIYYADVKADFPFMVVGNKVEWRASQLVA